MLNQCFAALRLEKHPGKTTIGRVERGFDFLGYRLKPEGFRIASATLARFVARATQLYEQEPGANRSRLGLYVQRWCSWARAFGGSFLRDRGSGPFLGEWDIPAPSRHRHRFDIHVQ